MLLVLVIAIAVPSYFRLGWSRMERHCSAEPPGKPSFTSVGFSFTSRGFTCEYDDGTWTEASYWFDQPRLSRGARP
jgi:hypothetical protein